MTGFNPQARGQRADLDRGVRRPAHDVSEAIERRERPGQHAIDQHRASVATLNPGPATASASSPQGCLGRTAAARQARRCASERCRGKAANPIACRQARASGPSSAIGRVVARLTIPTRDRRSRNFSNSTGDATVPCSAHDPASRQPTRNLGLLRARHERVALRPGRPLARARFQTHGDRRCERGDAIDDRLEAD